MSPLEEQLREDRALRDAAKAVLLADIEHARTILTPKGVADRVGGRIGDGAKDVFETAKAHADDNRGILAALIGAVLLWIAREPIMELLGLADAAEDADIAEEAAATDGLPEAGDSPLNSVEMPNGDDNEQ
jgi:hypothetical protein